MTVIVADFRKRVMASDSRVVGDYVDACTKLYASKRAVIGFAGDVSQALAFVDWYSDRRKRRPDITEETDWTALVMTSKGLQLWGPNLRPIPIEGQYAAIGSGAAHAITAMDCGVSAEDAVRMACKRNEGCALPVKSMRLK